MFFRKGGLNYDIRNNEYVTNEYEYADLTFVAIRCIRIIRILVCF